MYEESLYEELDSYVERGLLREALMEEGELSEDAVDLIITIVRRHILPKRRS